MSTRISIINDTKPDNISIFYLEPIFLVICDRTEFDNLKSIDESQKPGIYILLSSNKRYVGQASGSVLSRLEQHNINKDWWNKVIFFGRDDSHLSKSQLDYMEKSLIEKFTNLNINLDNSTVGNNSYINRIDKIKADNVLSQKDIVISKYTHINLYNISSNSHHDMDNKKENNQTRKIDWQRNSQSKYVELLGQKIYGSSNHDILLNVIAYLINKGYLNKLSKYISRNEEPTSTYIIGKHPVVSSKGRKLTKHIEDSDYYVYVNHNSRHIAKILQDIAKTINTDININM